MKLFVRALLIVIAIAVFVGAITLLDSGAMGIDPQTGTAPFGSGIIVSLVCLVVWAIEFVFIWPSLDDNDPEEDEGHFIGDL